MGHLRSLKILPFIISHISSYFLFIFHCSYRAIVYRFLDKARVENCRFHNPYTPFESRAKSKAEIEVHAGASVV